MLIKNKKSKGSKLEREFKEYFQKFGYHVSRAAGSFGIDLVAVKKDSPPLFINVKWKRNYCGPAERKELEKDSFDFGALPVIAYKFTPKGKKNGRHCISFYNCSSMKTNELMKPIILPPFKSCNEDELTKLLGFEINNFTSLVA
jgi:Holliday junction resolvase